MSPATRTVLVAALTWLGALGAPAAAGAAPVLTPIQGPAGSTLGVSAINNNGAVTGRLLINRQGRAYRWNGALQVLEPGPGDPFSSGRDINDAGTVVGDTSGGQPNRFFPAAWDPGSTAARVFSSFAGPCSGCVPQAEAVAVNAGGTILARHYQAIGRYRAVLLTGGTAREIATGFPEDITDEGTVVTSEGVVTGPRVNLTITCLRAQAISFSGTVVGSATAGNRAAPARWVGGRCTNLELPRGAAGGIALAVNRGGDIAGLVNIGRESHAAVWPNGRGVQLVRDQVRTPAGLQFTNVTGINDRGQLAVNAARPGASSESLATSAFVLTPAERPVLKLRTVQRLGASVPVRVRCDAGCRATVSGVVTVGKSKARTRTTRRTLGAGQASTLRVTLGRKAARLARRGVARGRRATVRLKIVTRGREGATRTTRPKAIRLRR